MNLNVIAVHTWRRTSVEGQRRGGGGEGEFLREITFRLLDGIGEVR